MLVTVRRTRSIAGNIAAAFCIPPQEVMDPSMVDEMKFEAPLAKFDCEEWSQVDDEEDTSEGSNTLNDNSYELNVVDNKAWLEMCVNNNNLVSLENAINKIFHSKQQDELYRNRTNTTMACSIERPCVPDINDNDNTEDIFGQNFSLGLDNFCETLSKSLEDLVNTFDERITKSLRNFEDKVQDFAPVQTSTIDYEQGIPGIIQDSAYFSDGGGNTNKWNCFRNRMENETSDLEDSSDDGGNYDNRDRDDENNVVVDDDDDDDDDDYDIEDDDDNDVITEGKADDDFEAFSQEPMITADEVINELEEILESNYNHPDGWNEGYATYESTLKWITNNNEYTDVETMTAEHLYDYVEGLENNIHVLSEELIKELDHRDELNYEKETKNRFLCLLMTVQKKKKEATVDNISSTNQQNKMKPYEVAFKKLKNLSERVTHKRSYLTTVIPYETSMGPPSLDTLCIYNQILYAMADDSPSALALLTDYILKVLCPKA